MKRLVQSLLPDNFAPPRSEAAKKTKTNLRTFMLAANFKRVCNADEFFKAESVTNPSFSINLLH